jgi:hypothetical protein
MKYGSSGSMGGAIIDPRDNTDLAMSDNKNNNIKKSYLMEEEKYTRSEPHVNRKVSRSRSRSRSKGKRNNNNNYNSKSRSPKRSPSGKYSTEYPHKGVGTMGQIRTPSPSRVPHLFGSAQQALDRRDVTKNSHYIDAKGEVKINISAIVPSYLVPYLIGKNGEVIKSIVQKTGCYISFHKENDSLPINTNEGIRGRLVSFVGTAAANTEAFSLLLEEIIKLESHINGARHEKL